MNLGSSSTSPMYVIVARSAGSAVSGSQRADGGDDRLWPEAADPGCPHIGRYRGEPGLDADIAEPARLIGGPTSGIWRPDSIFWSALRNRLAGARPAMRSPAPKGRSRRARYANLRRVARHGWVTVKETEGGHKRGHSAMALWVTHQEAKTEAGKRRRLAARRLVRKAAKEAGGAGGTKPCNDCDND